MRLRDRRRKETERWEKEGDLQTGEGRRFGSGKEIYTEEKEGDLEMGDRRES